MKQFEELKKEIDAIKRRNETVTIDKAWETSKTRKIVLIVCTYAAIGFYLQAIDISDPWLAAIVPSVGFLLSTLTLPYIKTLWIKNIYKK